MRLSDRLTTLLWSDKVMSLGATLLRSTGRVAAGVLVARATDSETFARYVTMIAVETIVSTIVNAAVTTPLVTLIPGAPPAQAAGFVDVARRVSRYLAVSGSLLGSIAVAALTGASGIEVIAFAAFVTASSLTAPCRAVLAAKFHSGRLLVAEMVFLLVAGAVLLFTHRLTGLSGQAVWCAFAAGAILAIPSLRQDRQAATSTEKIPVTTAATYRRVAVPMVVGSVGVSASSRMQPLILQWVMGAAAVATFGACQTLAGPIRIFSMSLSGVLRPRLSLHARRGDRVSFMRSLLTATIPTTVIGLLLTLAAASIGDLVIAAVFGPRVTGSSMCLTALMAYATFEAIGAMLAVAVQTLSGDGSRHVTRVRLAVAGLSLLGLWPSAAWGGAAGSAWALAAAELIFVVAMAASFRSAIRVTFCVADMPPTSHDLRITA